MFFGVSEINLVSVVFVGALFVLFGCSVVVVFLYVCCCLCVCLSFLFGVFCVSCVVRVAYLVCLCVFVLCACFVRACLCFLLS